MAEYYATKLILQKPTLLTRTFASGGAITWIRFLRSLYCTTMRTSERVYESMSHLFLFFFKQNCQMLDPHLQICFRTPFLQGRGCNILMPICNLFVIAIRYGIRLDRRHHPPTWSLLPACIGYRSVRRLDVQGGSRGRSRLRIWYSSRDRRGWDGGCPSSFGFDYRFELQLQFWVADLAVPWNKLCPIKLFRSAIIFLAEIKFDPSFNIFIEGKWLCCHVSYTTVNIIFISPAVKMNAQELFQFVQAS